MNHSVLHREDDAPVRAVSCAVFPPSGERECEASLAELSRLLDTAGAVEVGRVTQMRPHPDPASCIGSGKLEELAALCAEREASLVVFDCELSPSQIREIEDGLGGGTEVVDRSMLILDIFAARAITSEGKIQVELAQLQYRLARLVGLGRSLSRLGGGIGTRGPGEKKLEMDRRLVKSRIAQLRKELDEVKRHRELIRERRRKTKVPVAAIVGYTNAGKSTLLNQLTEAGVLEEDKLFATLDPTTRVLKLESGQEILLTDTVGFIRKLPHHLVEAFKSTLEEAKYADIILHVVDASNPQMDKQMHVVYDTLKQLGVENKTMITLFNKQDRLQQRQIQRDFRADYVLNISARTGEGLTELKDRLEEILTEHQILIERLYPYSEAGKIQLIRKYGQLLEEEYREDGIYVKAYVPREIYGNV